MILEIFWCFLLWVPNFSRGELSSVHTCKQTDCMVLKVSVADLKARDILLAEGFNDLREEQTKMNESLSRLKSENSVLIEVANTKLTQCSKTEELLKQFDIDQSRLLHQTDTLSTENKKFRDIIGRLITENERMINIVSNFIDVKSLNLIKVSNESKKEYLQSNNGKNEYTMQKEWLKPLASKSRTHGVKTRSVVPDAVAFYAKLAHTVNAPSINQRIVFDQIVTNEGHMYNPSSGVFTCYQPGIYAFFLNVMTETDKYFEASVVKNGVEFMITYSKDVNGRDEGSNFGFIDLEVGDAVWVKMNWGDHSGVVLRERYTTFSGFLIRTK